MNITISRTSLFIVLAAGLHLGYLGVGRATAQELPPICTPTPPPQPFILLYKGLASGCSNELGANKLCRIGETIEFRAGSQQILCPATEYNWQFPDSAPPPPLWKVDHVFTSAGTFNVTVLVTSGAGSGPLSAAVVVGDPAAVPIVHGSIALLLVAMLALVAVFVLR